MRLTQCCGCHGKCSKLRTTVLRFDDEYISIFHTSNRNRQGTTVMLQNQKQASSGEILIGIFAFAQ